MRTTYIHELEEFHNHLTRLGHAANESVHKAVKAYVEHDLELAHEVFSDDLRINASTADIEKEAYRLIALQQPVAGDLRMIFTVLHASMDLERIADHGVNIARSLLRREPDAGEVSKVADKISAMAEITQAMITDVISAFINQDIEAAREIATRDSQVDMLLKDIYRETSYRMQQDTELINLGLNYIGVATNLERMGDYVTNICERVIFLNSGEIVELN
ncbi:phosphate signaling complex protein PhoU [Vaginisenegalia massiliensis]|uniref:phosphate signaling complex protein PhoU n=1 Tax=Vaginisenegalia massiliensis TaxID=2058294 RepID=UPI000F547629|nr:phosphate signaling complex protein PhoU [Vaginisenegalia massiliensis]